MLSSRFDERHGQLASEVFPQFVGLIELIIRNQTAVDDEAEVELGQHFRKIAVRHRSVDVHACGRKALGVVVGVNAQSDCTLQFMEQFAQALDVGCVSVKGSVVDQTQRTLLWTGRVPMLWSAVKPSLRGVLGMLPKRVALNVSKPRSERN